MILFLNICCFFSIDLNFLYHLGVLQHTACRKLGVQKSLPDGELTSSLSVVVTVAKPRKGTIMPSCTVVQIHYTAGAFRNGW